VYKFIKNADKKKNVSKDYIDSVEKKYNIRFPKILREYYLNYNYSNEKKCVFFIEGCSEEFELDIILPLKYGTEPMEQAYEYILRADEVSNDFITFARDIDNGKYYVSARDCRHNKTGSFFVARIMFSNNAKSFCEGIIMVSSYGKKFVEEEDNYSVDEMKRLIIDNIFPCYQRLLETELGMLYFRHKKDD